LGAIRTVHVRVSREPPSDTQAGSGRPKKAASLPLLVGAGVCAYGRVVVGEALNDKDIRNSETSKTDKRKQSLYFPESMLQEIKDEAARLDRSLSWVVQRAWKLARLEIKKLPSVNDVADDDDTGD
jgi:uncharacterized small protein (TIGR04563 family)